MEQKKNNAKLNALLAIEKELQEKWERERPFEEDATNSSQ
jgi:leucyl-tRNA synthetase